MKNPVPPIFAFVPVIQVLGERGPGGIKRKAGHLHLGRNEKDSSALSPVTLVEDHSVTRALGSAA